MARERKECKADFPCDFAKKFTKEETDIMSLSSQISSLQNGFTDFVKKQETQEEIQEKRLIELEKFMTKEKALYTIRQMEIRIVYAVVASGLTYIWLNR